MPKTAARKKAPPSRPARAAPAPEAPKTMSVEERTAFLEARLQKADPSFQAMYRENLDMSWIYHDSALEGVVYTFQELKTAIDPTSTVVADSSMQPVC